jgi:hypothetical protein
MTVTYRTSPDDWAPGYMAVHIYDDGRYAVVIDGRPVFSGTGYQPGPFHDQRMQVADLLAFAYYKVGDGRLPVRDAIWPDDVATVGHELESVT